MKIFVALCFSALVASGLCCTPSTGGSTDTGGSTAAPAGGSTSTAAQASSTADPNKAACQAVACDFSSGLCQYKAGGDDQTWKQVSGRSGNRDTGISGPDQGGSQYVDARPKKGGKSSLTSGDLNNAADIQVLVRYWECTNKMNIKEATTNQDVSRDGVDASDRQWNTKIIKVPASTKNLNFACDNHGDNIGDCGIAKVTVVDANGNDVCGGGGGGGGGGGAGSSTAAAAATTAAPSKKRRTQRRRKQQ